MSPQGMPGETAVVYMLCQLFKANPNLHFKSIVIHESGKVEVAAIGEHGTLRDWCRALPEHHMHTALVPAMWGASEADVIEGSGITVTVKRPLVGPGGVA